MLLKWLAPVLVAAAAPSWGLWQPGNNPVTYQVAGHAPRLAINYFGWQELPNGDQLAAAKARGSRELIEMQSDGTTLQAISAGQWDHYLTLFGQRLEQIGIAVDITFDHEQNGSWYSWGQQPAAWRAAWNHVTDAVNAGCACNLITWVDAPNVIVDKTRADSLGAYWPVRNVDMLSLDGYLNAPSDTFSSVFARSIAAWRKLSGKPLIIAEVGVRASDPTAVAQVRGLMCNGRYPVAYFNARDWKMTAAMTRAFLGCAVPKPSAPEGKTPPKSTLRVLGWKHTDPGRHGLASKRPSAAENKSAPAGLSLIRSLVEQDAAGLSGSVLCYVVCAAQL